MNGPRPQPAVLQTSGFAHYSLAWSPFHTTRLALASSANFGLVGNGRLHLVSVTPGPNGQHALNVDKQYETQDGLYDVAWSEIHENQLVTASGDGSLRLWDVMLNDLPIRAWQEHTREVFSVDWSNIKKDTFASSSWDGTIKLWSPERQRSLITLQAHHSCVYQALFSPHQPDTIASCSTDGTLKVFDLRTPSYVTSGPNSNTFTNPISAAVLTVPASGTEVLTLDWNKYRPFVLASAGVDKMIKVWDCRMIKMGESGQVGGICETQLPGHEYAVRKVQWSPHRAEVLASASYDMTCRVWNTAPPPGHPQLLNIHDPHTEFVVGCGWSLYEEGVLASSHQELDAEDILLGSLETLYDYQPIILTSAGSLYTHTTPSREGTSPITIVLRTPDTQAANWSLHASSIWASSIYLADHLDNLHLDKHKATSSNKDIRVLELGASAGLPGILIAKTTEDVLVTVSDYPDEQLIRTLTKNVESNEVSARCRAIPYGWGSDPSKLLEETDGFDVVIAADTLWNPDLHSIFIDALRSTLRKSPTARVHLVVGLHTGRYTIQSFLKAVQEGGFDIESAIEKKTKDGVSREWNVMTEGIDDDKERRRWVVWITLRWQPQILSKKA
ncbi:WD40-repeat-containing domain protein [Crucibulum laeve]|uniref:Peroxin-7 n=1 Tax=Crucibulum laeve TaxID=68775 RepID=A0A5C3M4P1_9AGAR|nr:WD40-repeat-containing domain protein [Crucibulum laeve]